MNIIPNLDLNDNPQNLKDGDIILDKNMRYTAANEFITDGGWSVTDENNNIDPICGIVSFNNIIYFLSKKTFEVTKTNTSDNITYIYKYKHFFRQSKNIIINNGSKAVVKFRDKIATFDYKYDEVKDSIYLENINQIKIQIANINKQLATLSKEKDIKAKPYLDADKANNDLIAANEELKSKIDSINAEIKKLNHSIEDTKITLRALNDSKKSLKEKIDNLKIKIADIKNTAGNDAPDLSFYEEVLADYQSQMESINKNIDKYNTILANNENERNKLVGQVETLQRTYDNNKAKIDAYVPSNENKDYIDIVSYYTKHINDLNNQLNTYNDEIERYKLLHDEYLKTHNIDNINKASKLLADNINNFIKSNIDDTSAKISITYSPAIGFAGLISYVSDKLDELSINDIPFYDEYKIIQIVDNVNSNNKEVKYTYNYIYRFNERTKQFDEIKTAWKWRGGEIHGSTLYNNQGNEILIIAEQGDNIPLKFINLKYADTDKDEEYYYSQSPLMPIKNLVLSGYYNNTIPNGTYTFFIRYIRDSKYYTKWIPCSKPLFAANTNVKNTILGGVKYVNLHRDSDKSFILNVDNIWGDTLGYRQFQIGFILNHEDSKNARVWKTFPIETTKLYFDYKDVTEIDIEEFEDTIYELTNVGNVVTNKTNIYISNYNETDFNDKDLKDANKKITYSIGTNINISNSKNDKEDTYIFNGETLTLKDNIYTGTIVFKDKDINKFSSIKKNSVDIKHCYAMQYRQELSSYLINQHHNSFAGSMFLSVTKNKNDIDVIPVESEYTIRNCVLANTWGDDRGASKIWLAKYYNGDVDSDTYNLGISVKIGLAYGRDRHNPFHKELDYTSTIYNDIYENYGFFPIYKDSANRHVGSHYGVSGSFRCSHNTPDISISNNASDKGIAFIKKQLATEAKRLSYSIYYYTLLKTNKGDIKILPSKYYDEDKDKIDKEDDYYLIKTDKRYTKTTKVPDYDKPNNDDVRTPEIKKVSVKDNTKDIINFINNHIKGITADKSSIVISYNNEDYIINTINVVYKKLNFKVDNSSFNISYPNNLNTIRYDIDATLETYNEIYSLGDRDSSVYTTNKGLNSSVFQIGSKFDIYTHFVNNKGVVYNGIYNSTHTIDKNGLNQIIYEINDKAKPILQSKNIVALFASIDYKYYTLLPIFNIKNINEKNYKAECIEIDALIVPITNGINIVKWDGNKLVDVGVGSYKSSGSTEPLVAFGNVGFIYFQLDKYDANGQYFIKVIKDETDIIKNESKQLIKSSGYTKIEYGKKTPLKDIFTQHYDCEVIKPNYDIASDLYISGSDIYKIVRDKLLIIKDNEDYIGSSAISVNKIISPYNVNCLNLSSDINSTIFRYNTKPIIKEVNNSINSITLSDIYAMQGMYKEPNAIYFANKNINPPKTRFDNTIRQSEVLSDDQIKKTSFNFKANNYYNVQTNRGIITKLLSIANNIYCHCEDALFKFNNTTSLATTDAQDVNVTSKNLFDVGISIVSDSEYGYGGLSEYHSSAITNKYYFFYDAVVNHLYRYDGQSNMLSFDTPIKNVLKYQHIDDAILINDESNDRILIQLISDNKIKCVVSYNYIINKFISLHSIKLDNIIYSRTNVYGYNSKMIIKMFDDDSKKYDYAFLKAEYDMLKEFSTESGVIVVFPAGDDNCMALTSVSYVCGNYKHKLLKNYEFTPDNGIKTYVKALQIYSDQTETDVMDVEDIRYNNKEMHRYHDRLNANAISGYMKPIYEVGYWFANYFRNRLNNKPLYTEKTVDKYGTTLADLSDNKSLIYGKWIAVKLEFVDGNRIKFDSININTSKYGKL